MDDDVEENGNHIDLETSKERETADAQSQHYTFNTQHLHVRNSGSVQTERGVGKRKRNLQSKLGSRNIPVQLTISDDEDNYSASLESKDAQDQNSQDSRETYQDHTEYNTEEPGNCSTANIVSTKTSLLAVSAHTTRGCTLISSLASDTSWTQRIIAQSSVVSNASSNITTLMICTSTI